MSEVVKKNAILKGLVEGVVTELLVKTNAANVYYDAEETTTMAAKIAEIIADLAEKADATDVTAEINTAISGLINGAPETYDTLKEIADYIAAHEDVVTALNEAIGTKATKEEVNTLSGVVDGIKATVEALGALANKDKVGEADFNAELAEKFTAINTAVNGLATTYATKTELQGVVDGLGDMAGKDKVAEGDLDTELAAKIAAHETAVNSLGTLATKSEVTEAELNSTLVEKINASAQGNHSHANKEVLDGISAEMVTEWNSKGTMFVQASQPADLAAGDLWVQLVD